MLDFIFLGFFVQPLFVGQVNCSTNSVIKSLCHIFYRNEPKSDMAYLVYTREACVVYSSEDVS